MSFSSDIKKELNKTSNLANKELVKYELIGYLMSNNIDLNNKKIKYTTESDYNINRFSRLLANLGINHSIEINGKVFAIRFNTKEITSWFEIFEKENNSKNQELCIKQELINEISKKTEYKKAIIRGMFMGAGSINNPDNKYHMEIILSNIQNLNVAENLLKDLGISVKKMQVKNRNSIYIKDAEEISKFLALIEANKAVLKFEDIRVQKEMREKVNRIVNCNTANLNKTINASIEQIAAIEKIKNKGKFKKLENNLQEIADLRIKNPNASLVELGKMLKEPIGKSGVNYRLKKIVEIAKEL